MKDIYIKFKKNLKNKTLISALSKTLKNRFIRWIKHSNIFYPFNKKRVLTKHYQKDIPPINTDHYVVGNYFLDKRLKLNKDSIIYSLGILQEITFDTAVSNKFGCTINMFDPTPVSIEFMKQHQSNQLLKFKAVGVWTENTTLKFYEPKHGGSSSVMYNVGNNFFEAECLTMKSLLSENNHTHIDVFKADIEGAALPILEQMISQKILPHQIITEFERPRGSMDEVNDFFDRISNIRSELKKIGYEEFILPRKAAKYFSLEMLFVNTNME